MKKECDTEITLVQFCENLIAKSKESFLLAVEIFNKPSLEYKTECFSFLITNAWELLLKATIAKDNGKEKIFYKNGNSLSIDDCIKNVFPNPNNLIRKNITEIAEIRNYATHLIIPNFNKLLQPLFQASVINYLKFLSTHWEQYGFNEFYTYPLIVDNKNFDDRTIKDIYGSEALSFFNNKKGRIANLVQDSTTDVSELFIPITYNLAYTKDVSKADILSYYNTNGIGFNGLFIAKDIDKSHPYSYTELKNKLYEKYGDALSFSSGKFSDFKEKYNIKNKPHFYKEFRNTKVYSEACLNFIIEKMEKDTTLFRK